MGELQMGELQMKELQMKELQIKKIQEHQWRNFLREKTANVSTSNGQKTSNGKKLE